MYREMVDWSVHVEYLRPDFLGYVISGVPAGDNERLAQRKFPRAAGFLSPWLLKNLADDLLQLVELLSVQS